MRWPCQCVVWREYVEMSPLPSDVYLLEGWALLFSIRHKVIKDGKNSTLLKDQSWVQIETLGIWFGFDWDTWVSTHMPGFASVTVNGRRFAIIQSVWCFGNVTLKHQLHLKSTSVVFCVVIALNVCCLPEHQHGPVFQSFQVLQQGCTTRGSDWCTSVHFPELLVK